jgi:hypothetical protein
VAFAVVIAVELTVAAGALVEVALEARLVLAMAAGALETEALDPEVLGAALALAEVASVVPDAAATLLETTELVELVELADPDDAVFQ